MNKLADDIADVVTKLGDDFSKFFLYEKVQGDYGESELKCVIDQFSPYSVVFVFDKAIIDCEKIINDFYGDGAFKFFISVLFRKKLKIGWLRKLLKEEREKLWNSCVKFQNTGVEFTNYTRNDKQLELYRKRFMQAKDHVVDVMESCIARLSEELSNYFEEGLENFNNIKLITILSLIIVVSIFGVWWFAFRNKPTSSSNFRFNPQQTTSAVFRLTQARSDYLS
ncbi:hypothetical protein RIF25_10560 [Thermosynechococcaceae cyanobacterium BACA0444]|uniref:Uncharacterized protein n=1 Tax=Pseudocalidococcus azoricus BACA0444 TaxID=2918990 RepID=A0AAE4FSZ1_9CYAN|nr:hypothetical protein [Pseudocalidococcus azoricus]MDS3861248.1 hypothetical protein [Pseudocalidococcus azoricus BACA0444]